MVEAVGLEVPAASLQALRGELCCLVAAPRSWFESHIAVVSPDAMLGAETCNRRRMVEAVGLEPTSEERVLETSTCVAFDLSSRRSR